MAANGSIPTRSVTSVRDALELANEAQRDAFETIARELPSLSGDRRQHTLMREASHNIERAITHTGRAIVDLGQLGQPSC